MSTCKKYVVLKWLGTDADYKTLQVSSSGNVVLIILIHVRFLTGSVADL